MDEDLIGTVIKNRYRVDAFLGRGGMAEVYRVFDRQRTAPLAMKLLHDDLAEDAVFLKRFNREGKTLETLQHPNIVRFYGLEEDSSRVFMLMDFVDGITLRKEIKAAGGKAMPLESIMAVMRPVCSALNYAHHSGVIHCDVKPANIMIDKSGRVLLADFGIARSLEGTTTTLAGAGTPAYMAPEQVAGKDPTPQMDIYALGVILYEMLTGGDRPFTGDRATKTGTTSEKIRWEKTHLDPASILDSVPGLSIEMRTVIQKCLAKTPKSRYGSVPEFLEALETALGTNGVEILHPPLTGFTHSNSHSQGSIPPNPDPPKPNGIKLWWGQISTGWKAGLVLGVCFLMIWLAFKLGNTSSGEGQNLNYSLTRTEVSVTNVNSKPAPTLDVDVIPTQEWEPTNTPRPTTTPKSEPSDEAWKACPNTYLSRLHVGNRAYVSFDPPLSNRVRSSPSKNASVSGKIGPGEKMKILDGPKCADDWVWWKISSEDAGTKGWTSEGDYEDYWLVPLP